MMSQLPYRYLNAKIDMGPDWRVSDARRLARIRAASRSRSAAAGAQQFF